MKKLSREQLAEIMRKGEATIAVDHIHHEEYVYGGRRYYCGWDSQKDPGYKPKKWDDPPYQVFGWIVYKVLDSAKA